LLENGTAQRLLCPSPQPGDPPDESSEPLIDILDCIATTQATHEVKCIEREKDYVGPELMECGRWIHQFAGILAIVAGMDREPDSAAKGGDP
jgi:hypothetical protein